VVPKTERFELRLDEALLEKVDKWRAQQDDLLSRAEAMRQLVEASLAQESRKVIHLTDGEKLIFMMLRDLFKGLKITPHEIDIEFMSDVIFGGHYWAPRWKMHGLFHGHEDDPRDVSYVVNVLDMWDFLERGYERLSAEEHEAIAAAVPHHGKHVRFPGFDGNNEAAKVGIAYFLVEKMERFTRFSGRDLNSHFPTDGRYERMLPVFERTRNKLIGRDLGRDEIIAILQAGANR
jgi:uncharacterized protein YfbU (UPF0304 family)